MRWPFLVLVGVARACLDDYFLCANGLGVARDPARNCSWPPCPNTTTVPPQGSPCAEAPFELHCPSGDVVIRDPRANCSFPQCPEGCAVDTKRCPSGAVVRRCPARRCAFEPCPPLVRSPSNAPPTWCQVCADDSAPCPGAGRVRRNAARHCAFDPCPGDRRCGSAVKRCVSTAGDVTWLRQQPALNCSFLSCP
ncbi:hypothetical protein ACHHYP_14500 [Achlya hypogyna]|uniref:Secreted protein n=1 Tax=Achlya hypogyna TaxID=1202772 RepID=A0A0A7CPI9_ACHHY|nr:secreted protein [Achlya hypogyna]OQR83604.1 hypothetical protein ACHHYP_14500 [Achlya hypogyna]